MTLTWSFRWETVELGGTFLSVAAVSYFLSMRMMKGCVGIQGVNFQGSEKLDKYILDLIADYSSSTDRALSRNHQVKLDEMAEAQPWNY